MPVRKNFRDGKGQPTPLWSVGCPWSVVRSDASAEPVDLVAGELAVMDPSRATGRGTVLQDSDANAKEAAYFDGLLGPADEVGGDVLPFLVDDPAVADLALQAGNGKPALDFRAKGDDFVMGGQLLEQCFVEVVLTVVAGLFPEQASRNENLVHKQWSFARQG